MKKISKILILGGPGSGKTTLANKLEKLFELPIINLDNIHYKKEWVPRDKKKEIISFKEKLMKKNGLWKECINQP